MIFVQRQKGFARPTRGLPTAGLSMQRGNGSRACAVTEGSGERARRWQGEHIAGPAARDKLNMGCPHTPTAEAGGKGALMQPSVACSGSQGPARAPFLKLHVPVERDEVGALVGGLARVWRFALVVQLGRFGRGFFLAVGRGLEAVPGPGVAIQEIHVRQAVQV